MRGSGGMSYWIVIVSVPRSVLRITGAGEAGNTPGIGEGWQLG